MKIHKIWIRHHISIKIRGMIRVVAILVTCQGSAQIPPEINRQINQAIADGDFHVASLAVGELESRAKSVPDGQKLPFVREAVNFAAAIFGKCDPSLHSLEIGSEPTFDWRKYGIRPLFNGVSAEAIEDPVVKEAYKLALAEHRKLLVRVSAERQKLEEGDYCARAAFRVIESSANRRTLDEAVDSQIASIKDAQWIRERLIQIVLPKKQAKEQSPPQSELSGSRATSQPQSSVATPPLQTVAPPEPEKAPSTSPTTTPSEESTSSTPWSIIVVLIIAVTGLLGLLLKGRK